MPLTSFYTALTGLNNNSVAINVIGDNLANMNTTAFKSSKASFQELLAGLSGTSSTGNPVSFGLGSTLNGVNRSNSQGAITYTGTSTDAAINGNGFFIVSTEGGMGFTRSGQFEFDKNGNFLSADGFQLLGYPAVGDEINVTTGISPIEIRKGQLIPANATENIYMPANLSSAAEVDSTNPYTYPAYINVYDSLGNEVPVTITFTKTGSLTWTWSATVPPSSITGASEPVEVGSGDLEFDDMGKLIDPAENQTLTIEDLASGGADMDITLNLFDNDGNSLITTANSASDCKATKDGNGASTLASVTINNEGVIVGLTEAGNSVPLAQLALADFPNVDGLQKFKGSTFVAFTSCGDPSIGTAGSGGRGTIVGSSLEKSNVDMAQEFVSLIVAQRAYQANSRIISTTDELYQDAINLKR